MPQHRGRVQDFELVVCGGQVLVLPLSNGQVCIVVAHHVYCKISTQRHPACWGNLHITS